MTTQYQKQATEALGLREGTKVHKAAALYLRKGGATTEEVMKETGTGPQLNILARVQAAGHNVTRKAPEGGGKTAYRIRLVPGKGKAKTQK